MSLSIINLYLIFLVKIKIDLQKQKRFMNLFDFLTLNKKDEHYRNLELANLYELGVDEKELIKNKALLQEKWSNYEYMED